MTGGEQSVPEDATILIVDDEKDLADLYAMWLGDTYESTAVYSGDEALDRLDQGFDVILLDRGMPHPSGDDVLDCISTQDIGVNVALLSVIPPDLDLLDMEFDAYLSKPVTRSELREEVDNLLTISECEEPLQELYALVSKRAALESQLPARELETTDEFTELVGRISQLQAQSQEALGETGTEDFQTLFSGLRRDRMETD